MSEQEGFRELVGFVVDAAEQGALRATLEAGPAHLNPNGTVHGGAVTTLADASMGEVVANAFEDGRPITIELKVTFLKPGRPGTLTSTARVIKQGKMITLAQAEVSQDDDLIAHALGTYTMPP